MLVLKIWPFFTEYDLVMIEGALSALYRLIDKFVKNVHNMSLSSQPPLKKKINTVHNLITFSIVFTNKIRGGGALLA